MTTNKNPIVKICLFNEVFIFVKNNILSLSIILFLILISYGYYITSWAISIDSEFATFALDDNITEIFNISVGRPVLSLMSFLLDLKVLPYFNDLTSILLIYVSAIIWLVNLSHIKINLNAKELIIFALLYSISPIYIFQLRFTEQNFVISFGFVFISIAAFYLIKIFTSIFYNLPIKKTSFLTSTIYLALAAGIYQMFITYFITCIMFIITLYIVSNNNLKKITIAKFLISSSLVFIIGAGLYQLICNITYVFIPKSNYTDHFMLWGKDTALNAITNICNYFVVIVNYPFNIVIKITLICSIPFIALNIYKKPSLALFFILLVISSFTLPIMLGSNMPLRTMQVIPLFIASSWTIILFSLTKKSHKNIAFGIMGILCLINANFITRIAYSDNMRQEYDKNFANQLYTYIITNSGDAIKKKPLVILGKHSYLNDKPFMYNKPPLDTIGFSFFEWDNGNYRRIFSFMKWLGDEYILPTPNENNSALKLAIKMPIYPAKGSLRETESLVIIKLSE